MSRLGRFGSLCRPLHNGPNRAVSGNEQGTAVVCKSANGLVTGDRLNGSRGAGWEYVHVAIDDHSRLAFSTIYPDETARSACWALLDAVRCYASLGIRFKQVLTDNGGCYTSGSSACADFWAWCIGVPGPTVHAPRQSRALHPDRSEGMGLYPVLRHLRATRQTPGRLATPVQLASTTRQLELPSSHQQSGPLCEQPIGFTHLVFQAVVVLQVAFGIEHRRNGRPRRQDSASIQHAI